MGRSSTMDPRKKEKKKAAGSAHNASHSRFYVWFVCYRLQVIAALPYLNGMVAGMNYLRGAVGRSSAMDPRKKEEKSSGKCT